MKRGGRKRVTRKVMIGILGLWVGFFKRFGDFCWSQSPSLPFFIIIIISLLAEPKPFQL